MCYLMLFKIYQGAHKYDSNNRLFSSSPSSSRVVIECYLALQDSTVRYVSFRVSILLCASIFFVKTRARDLGLDHRGFKRSQL